MANPIAPRRRTRQRGSEVLEFSFVIIPTLGLIMMVVDIAWLVYVRGTLMYAAQNGARYAMANRIDPVTHAPVSDAAEMAATFNVMKYRANGLLDDVPECNYSLVSGDWTLTPADQKCMSVVWYDPKGAGGYLKPVPISSSGGANKAGNIVVVSIMGYKMSPLLGIFMTASGAKYDFVFSNIASSDRME